MRIKSVLLKKKNVVGLVKIVKLPLDLPFLIIVYFNARIKEVQETFLKESNKYLEQHDPGLLYNIKNKPLPKEQKKTIIKTSTEDNELDKYQKEREQKRKEELVKRTQISVAKPFSFSETGKKDPCRGMRWVNPFESINQTRLGHSQTWRDNKSKKEYY